MMLGFPIWDGYPLVNIAMVKSTTLLGKSSKSMVNTLRVSISILEG